MFESAVLHDAHHCEIHLGKWIDSPKLHGHIVLDTTITKDFLEQYVTEEADTYMKMRKIYEEKTASKRAAYHSLDAKKINANLDAPMNKVVTSNEKVRFDASQSTSVMMVMFDKPLINMSIQELESMLKYLKDLCIDDLNMNLNMVRVIIPPEVYVTCLPRKDRQKWMHRW